MIAFLVLIYGVYMMAMLSAGSVSTPVCSEEHPFAITIGPAIVAAVAILVFLAIAFVPEDLERRLGRIAPAISDCAPGYAGWRPVPSLCRAASTCLAQAAPSRLAMIGTVSLVGLQHRGSVRRLSRLRFGSADRGVVQAYFVGMLANLLPLPGESEEWTVA